MAMLRDLDQLQDCSGLQSKIADVGPQPNCVSPQNKTKNAEKSTQTETQWLK